LGYTGALGGKIAQKETSPCEDNNLKVSWLGRWSTTAFILIVGKSKKFFNWILTCVLRVCVHSSCCYLLVSSSAYIELTDEKLLKGK